MAKNLLSIGDLTTDEILYIVDQSAAHRVKDNVGSQILLGKSIALLFEKPSLRTKVSFSKAIHELGGHSIFLGHTEVGLGDRESVEDVAQVLSRYVSAIVARVNRHNTLERIVDSASIPVINALSDVEHPCQALGDLATIHQHIGISSNITVAYIGDANNVALSLALVCAAVGINFHIASPSNYGFLRESRIFLENRFGSESSGKLLITDKPKDAAINADVIYTDVWTSMGQENEATQRSKAFSGFQINEELLILAKPNAIFMHPMPAHYGQEVAPNMLNHPKSVVYDQAENRLYAQKSVFELLLSLQ